MSKKAARGAKARDRVPPRTGGDSARAPGQRPASLPPFKPRPGLFYGLLTAFALWVGILLGLYFLTVYPHRRANTERPADAPQQQTISHQAP